MRRNAVHKKHNPTTVYNHFLDVDACLSHILESTKWIEI